MLSAVKSENPYLLLRHLHLQFYKLDITCQELPAKVRASPLIKIKYLHRWKSYINQLY